MVITNLFTARTADFRGLLALAASPTIPMQTVPCWKRSTARPQPSRAAARPLRPAEPLVRQQGNPRVHVHVVAVQPYHPSSTVDGQAGGTAGVMVLVSGVTCRESAGSL